MDDKFKKWLEEEFKEEGDWLDEEEVGMETYPIDEWLDDIRVILEVNLNAYELLRQNGVSPADAQAMVIATNESALRRAVERG